MNKKLIKCSLCGSIGSNKKTCPLNQTNKKKHKKIIIGGKQTKVIAKHII